MTQATATEGFVYVATGERHLREARISVESLRKAMPNAHVTLFTDGDVTANPVGFDQVLKIEGNNGSFADKIEPLARSPYVKTVYLDTDTYIANECLNLFQVLDRFDIAVAHDPWRVDFASETLPDAFPTLNTGLIAFRSGPNMVQFVSEWLANHQSTFRSRQPDDNDQPAFRHTVYHSQLRLCILPAEYNLRTWYPCFIGGFGKVRVIHDRNRHAPSIARLLNTGIRPRIYGWIEPRLLLFYAFQKVDNIVRRRIRSLFHKKK